MKRIEDQPRVSSLVLAVAAFTLSAALGPIAWARHPAPRTSVQKGERRAVAPSRMIEGEVIEVRRMSRDVTICSRAGTVQHVLVPRDATIRAPLGERGLSGIRRGMMLHVVDGGASGKIVAHEIVAHAKTGGEWQGRPALHRAAR